MLLKKEKLSEKIGPLGMHSAIGVMPEWLTKRSCNTNYWTQFHKWNFSQDDPIPVTLLLSVEPQNWDISARWSNQ